MATTQKLSSGETNKKAARLETTGKSSYAILHQPQIDKKYPVNADGSPKRPTYRITVVYKSGSDPALKDLKAHIKKYGIKRKMRELTDENGNETGEYSFTFERVAFKDEETGEFLNPPVLVDKQNRPIAKDVLIGNGSTVKVVYTPRAFTGPSGSGHTFQLLGVQVIDLIRYTPPPMFSSMEESGDGSGDDSEGLASF